MTSGLMILEKNYLLVYTYDTWKAKTVPAYHDGEQFLPSSLLMNQAAKLYKTVHQNSCGTTSASNRRVQTT